MKKLLSLLLVTGMLLSLLTGCALLDMVEKVISGESGSQAKASEVAFRDMEYVRPDLDEHRKILDESCRIARESTDISQVLDAVDAYYDIYDRISASNSLADIHASAQADSTYWQEESAFCAAAAVEISGGLEEFYCALAVSPILEEVESFFGDGYFDYYREMGQPDKVWQDYLAQESELVEEYTTLFSDFDPNALLITQEMAMPMAEILVELVALRQEMAAYMEYDSYPALAYDLHHYRDYTPQEAMAYLEQVPGHMAQLYRDTFYSSHWNTGIAYASEEDIFSYVDSATVAMGGSIREAFSHMRNYGLYDISVDSNKRPISYETYIFHYEQPYVFTCPFGIRSDCLDFAHEFGHFANDRLLNPSYVGTDVAEVQSQGMEYMSLFYADGGQELTSFKLLDSLGVYTEQSAYSLFEHKLYDLPAGELTPEKIQALFLEVGNRFGFDCWEDFTGWEFVSVSHFYEIPMYVMSYVVSNDMAFQIYQKELETTGEGLALYKKCLESDESYILTFAQEYGLESPFAPGRLEAVRRTLEESLG